MILEGGLSLVRIQTLNINVCNVTFIQSLIKMQRFPRPPLQSSQACCEKGHGKKNRCLTAWVESK